MCQGQGKSQPPAGWSLGAGGPEEAGVTEVSGEARSQGRVGAWADNWSRGRGSSRQQYIGDEVNSLPVCIPVLATMMA